MGNQNTIKASKENPVYTVYLVSGGAKYDLTPVVESISFTEQKKQLARSAQVKLVNVKVGSVWLTDTINVRDRIFVYADDGERNDEVFRGYVWTRSYKSRLDGHNITLRCYDNLIYWQESEDAEYFQAGKTTAQVMGGLCGKWGVSLSYQYESIVHSKLALRGTISNLVTDDILDVVKDRTGKKYVILSDKDTVVIKCVGTNSTIYTVKAGHNAIEAGSTITLDGVVTKVLILSKAGEDDRVSVDGTESGQTGKYGTLQKIISRKESASMEDCRKEAQNIIKEDGTPKMEYELTTVDIPWIRKGDAVNASAGNFSGKFIVVGLERDISNKAKKMTLTLEKA